MLVVFLISVEKALNLVSITFRENSVDRWTKIYF